MIKQYNNKNLKQYLNSFSKNRIFSLKDLNHLDNYEAIKRQINRYVHNGYLKQLARGIYCKTQMNNLTDLDEIANVLANKNGWLIAKSGAYVLHYLGLSLQVPYRYVYASTGPYKTYKFNNLTIIFKHVRSGDLVNYDNTTATLIQAIKMIGKNNLSKKHIDYLSKFYSSKDKKTILSNKLITPIWINKAIYDICRG